MENDLEPLLDKQREEVVRRRRLGSHVLLQLSSYIPLFPPLFFLMGPPHHIKIGINTSKLTSHLQPYCSIIKDGGGGVINVGGLSEFK